MATIKQKKALKALMENGGNLGKAMRTAGYSETTALNPQNLTEADGFKELIAKVLPDEMLVKVHKEGLKATSKKPHLIDRDDKGRPVYEYVEETDFATRHRYLETAYKLHGRLMERIDHTTKGKAIINNNIAFIQYNGAESQHSI